MNCPRWKQFLKESVQDDASIEALREFFGSCVTSDPMPAAALVLAGSGLGKTTVVKVLTALVGTQARTDFTPQQMESLLVRARMASARLNVANDAVFTLRGLQILKSMIAGDRVSAETSGRAYFTYKPRTKFLFVSQAIPNIHTDDSLHRRFIVISFTARPAELDPFLLDRLAAELDGIYAWAVELMALADSAA